MRKFTQQRMQGSLWTKGRSGMIAGAALICILIIRVPVARWFIAIAIVIGVVMVPLIRWWNDSHPVKDPDADKIKLHLND